MAQAFSRTIPLKKWFILLFHALGLFAPRTSLARPLEKNATVHAPATDPMNDDRYLSSSDRYSIDLTQDGYVDNRRIILENTGTTDIVNPWVVINGKRNWFDINTMTREIAGGETNPEKLAFRVWRFVRDNRYHWNSAETGLEIHDPVKYFNVYGYGLCDDSASNAEALFTKLGFTTRSWWLTGHVIPEVTYNNAWHILDPDLEVFYPMRDLWTLAGVDECYHDGWLIQRISGPDVRQIYTTMDDNTIATGIWECNHTMALTLRPGERMKRCWFSWGAYHTIDLQGPPAVYGNGDLVYTPDLTGPTLPRGMETFQGFTQEPDSVTHPTLHPAVGGTTATLVCRMSCPYLLTGGYLGLDCVATADTDTITGDFSRNGTDWQPLGRVKGPFTDAVFWPLDDPLAARASGAVYTFWVRLKMCGTKPRAVGINNFTLQGEIQCAPASLPALEPEMVNNVSVTFSSAPGGELHIHHDFNVQSFTTTPLQPLLPEAGEYIPASELTCAWTSAGSDAQGYEVMISRDPDGLMPASPTLWQWVGSATSWTPPASWLITGHKYYWQVRYKDLLGNWRPWTKALSFTVGIKNAAHDWVKY